MNNTLVLNRCQWCKATYEVHCAHCDRPCRNKRCFKCKRMLKKGWRAL